MYFKRKIEIYFIIILILFLPTVVLISQQNVTNIFERNRITGDWNGTRTDLKNKGYSFEAVYKSEFWKVTHGNIPNDFAYVDNVDLILTMDLEKIFNWQGASFVCYVLGNNGQNPLMHNEYSIHGITNIAAPKAWKIYNIFLEQQLFDEKLSILFGTYDYNSEFDAKETASLFINPNHGIGSEIAQTGENGPSIFPTASLGLRLKAQPFNNTYIQTVILDGVPGDPNNPHWTHIILNKKDGFFCGTELGYANDYESEDSYLKIAAGLWYYTDNMDYVFSHINNYGAYFIIEKNLFRENDKKQGLSSYARLGFADRKVNEIDYTVSAGLLYTGLFPSRDDDQFGIAFIVGHLTKQNTPYFIPNKRFENNIELTYSFHLTPAIFLQPDLQYVLNSAHLENREDFSAFGLRIILNF